MKPIVALCCLVVVFACDALLAQSPARAEKATSGPHDLAEQLKTSLRNAVVLLEQASAGSAKQRTCFTCHSQAMPVLALTEAAERGLEIDRQNLKTQLEHTAKHLERGKAGYLQGKGQGGQVDTAGYALWTLEAGAWDADEITAAVAEFLLKDQEATGRWKRRSNRPPSEASHFTTTFLALYGLSAFATTEQQPRVEQARTLAMKWLMDTDRKPQDTEDRVFRLLALDWISADEKLIQSAAEQLMHQQRADGGWSQKDDMESDAYATGTVLVALERCGQLSADQAAYQRGVRYLLDSQQTDGSWHVASRSKPFQTHYETGFPHGKDQFISTTATSWATMALLRALPETNSAN